MKSLSLLSLGFIGLVFLGITTHVTAKEFSPEVKALLNQAVQDITQNLALHPVIVDATKISNQKNESLKLNEILRQDQEWQNAKEITPFIKTFIGNECARVLMDFQDQHPQFAEIFVADLKGVIVGETNKTSDYYQADEKWWQAAFNQGKGAIYFGEIEYDESALAESIPIAIPIMNDRTAIGVMKVLVDIVFLQFTFLKK